MKKTILFMALAMMFAVVQGYAQRSVTRGSSPSRSTSVSATRPATPVRSSSVTSTRPATPVRSSSVTSTRTATPVRSSSVTPTRTATTSRSSSVTPTRTATTSRSNDGYQSRSYSGRTQPTPQAPHHSGHHAPPPPKPRHGGGHHAPYLRHAHHYHHHHCTFEAWAWITYLDYSYRFVRHSYYADRFFDALLGTYLYGSLVTPNKILVGGTLFHRYSDYISVRCGNNVDCYYVYTDYHKVYYIGNNMVELIVGGGYVTLYIHDDYGNEATYYL